MTCLRTTRRGVSLLYVEEGEQHWLVRSPTGTLTTYARKADAERAYRTLEQRERRKEGWT